MDKTFHYLVAVDIHQSPEDFLNGALSAVSKEAQVTLLHVIDESFLPPHVAVDPDVIAPGILSKWRGISHKEAEAKMTHLRDVVTTKRPDLDVDAVVRRGVPSSIITELTETNEIDMVVTGCRELGRAAAWVLGSTTADIARNSVAPVVVLKDKPLAGYRKLLVPLDYSRFSASSLRLAAGLAGPNAEIEAMHVWHTPLFSTFRVDLDPESAQLLNDAKSAAHMQLTSFLETLPDIKGVRPHLCEGRVTEQILERADEIKADAIVIGSHGASGLKERFFGTVAERIVTHSDIPVVLMTPLATGFWLKPGDKARHAGRLMPALQDPHGVLPDL